MLPPWQQVFLIHTVCTHTNTHRHTHAYRFYCTLATCRGFCCSAPPWSLKPHGKPPERETTISSATIPAHSLLCVCVTVYKLISTSSVPHTPWVSTRENEASASPLHSMTTANPSTPEESGGGWLSSAHTGML